MISVDTNIVVRLLTNDDPGQAQRVAKLFDDNNIFITKTVLLETEWILRYAYNLPRPRICLSFKMLLGLPMITVEDSEAIRKAISWYAEGFDFADALHVICSVDADNYATFDKKLINKLKKTGFLPVIKP